MSALPLYQCHKQVRAFKIGRIEGCTLFPHDETAGIEPVEVSPEYISRHPLNQSGYYVRYEDGYESFSPAGAFESGYTRVDYDSAAAGVLSPVATAWQDASSMPLWQWGDRQVRAVKIEDIKPETDGALLVFMQDARGGYCWSVDRVFMEGFKAQVGGYLVVTTGGYVLYCPAEAFEARYARIDGVAHA